MHEQMLSSQAPSGSNGCRLEGRALAALVAVVLTLGIQISPLVSIATPEATQASILAARSVATRWCVLQGNVFDISADSPSSQRCEVAEATLPEAITKARAKGCTVAAGLNVMECYWAVRLYSVLRRWSAPSPVNDHPTFQVEQEMQAHVSLISKYRSLVPSTATKRESLVSLVVLSNK